MIMLKGKFSNFMIVNIDFISPSEELLLSEEPPNGMRAIKNMKS